MRLLGWKASVASVAAAQLRGLPRAGALPYEVFPTPRKTDALTLALYVKSSVGDVHFVAIPSSVKTIPATVKADDVVEPSRHEVFNRHTYSRGSFAVRAGERSTHVIEGLASGEPYDVYFILEAANSNGLFSPPEKILGVSTNGAAPSIAGLMASPMDASTNATTVSISMDAPGVECRVWYTVLPLIDTNHLQIMPQTADEISEGAKPDNFVALPQGLKGNRSAGTISDLEDDTWYQVSAVAERAEGVFSEPVFTVVKTHREPPTVTETAAKPRQGTIDSLTLFFRLDCSAAPPGEVCGLLRYQILEKLPPKSPPHAKPRQVAQGKLAVLDGRVMGHDVSGLSPGKAHSIVMMVETPGSIGAVGPLVEVEATTFPAAPRLVKLETTRNTTNPSTMTVRYKISEPGIVHISVAERIGHPAAMRAVFVGNQHGVNFFHDVGIRASGDEETENTALVLEGSQELQGIAAGSAFDVTACTESVSMGHPSGVFGESLSRTIDAVPPALVNVRARPPDATTTELLVEYEVLGTAGRLYYALVEQSEMDKGGKGELSAEDVRSAVQGQSGVVAVGSAVVSPGSGGSTTSSEGQFVPRNFHTRGLSPQKRYAVVMCTEGNSGTLSDVVTAFAQTHAEAPLVSATEIANVTAAPTDRLSGALSLTVELESAGLVHFVVRRAGKHGDGVISDHVVVHKGALDVNETVRSTTAPGGAAATGVVGDTVSAVEIVEGLEPGATYEIFLVAETKNSNGVYRPRAEAAVATTHPLPPVFLQARARAADASASAVVVTTSLPSPAFVHYAVFPAASSQETPPGDGADGSPTISGARPQDGNVAGVESEWAARNHVKGGCANATGSGRGAIALNETAGLVTSGVIFASRNSTSGEGIYAAAPAVAATVEAEVAKPLPTSNIVGLEAGQSAMDEGEPVEVVFYVGGLKASEAYDLCLFSETPGSNGLLGAVHALREVSTHAPVPELASERVACTLDCRGLNRDPCWLKANKCGECSEGFVGKAGHVNSPCGKASLLTEKDMARIAERERRERQEEHATDSQEKTANNEVIVSQSDLSAANVQSDAQGNSLQRNSTDGNVGGITGSDPPPRTSSDDGSLGVGVAVVSNGQGESSLLGVPVAVGPNVTKFLYVNVPRKGEAAANESGATQFDAEEAASGLCTELHGQVAVAGGNEEAETCLASLSTALASRYDDGRFHSIGSERPILQVEVDAPDGGSLAFTLNNGQDAGAAAVRFCRENRKSLPDEQECVITLMQEMSQ